MSTPGSLPPVHVTTAMGAGTGTGALPTVFHELYSLPTSDPCNGNCLLPLSDFFIGTGYDHNAIFDKMVGVNPSTTVMSFVGFFPCPGEEAGCSRLFHAPAICPGCLGELTPFDGKVHAVCDDIRSSTTPLVEFPEDAFEAIGPIWAHSKWWIFDLVVINSLTTPCHIQIISQLNWYSRSFTHLCSKEYKQVRNII